MMTLQLHQIVRWDGEPYEVIAVSDTEDTYYVCAPLHGYPVARRLYARWLPRLIAEHKIHIEEVTQHA